MMQGQKVRLKRTDSPAWKEFDSDITGTIIGKGHVVRNNVMVPLYLVELDQGFYSHDNRCWQTIMAVHSDNLEIPID